MLCVQCIFTHQKRKLIVKSVCPKYSPFYVKLYKRVSSFNFKFNAVVPGEHNIGGSNTVLPPSSILEHHIYFTTPADVCCGTLLSFTVNETRNLASHLSNLRGLNNKFDVSRVPFESHKHRSKTIYYKM